MGSSSRNPNTNLHGCALDATTEITTREELLARFTIEKINKIGQPFGIHRVAVTGRSVALPLFETMEALGKSRPMECISLAEDALSRLTESPSGWFFAMVKANGPVISGPLLSS